MTTDVDMFDPREMESAHKMFRREFSLMAPLVRGVAATDPERAAIVADHLDLFIATLHEHHGFEDEHIWPVLLGRVEQRMQPAVHQAAAEHHRLDDALADVASAAGRFRGGPATDSREDLATALDALLPILLGHMDFEEHSVVPLMRESITQAEWDEGISGLVGSLDPGQLPLIFGLQMYEADPEVADLAFAKVPEELQPIIRRESMRMFAEYAQRIHGTQTPARSIDMAVL